jgi:hypothetical protein
MYRVIWWAIHPHSQLLSSLCTVCASPYMHAAMIGVPLQNKCAIQDSNARKVRINTPYFRFSLRGYQTESRMLLGLWATILQRSLTPTSKLVLLTYELWKISLTISHTTILFACLIIHTFQLVFSARTVFFSHNKSANSTFSHDFSAKRTVQWSRKHGGQHTKTAGKQRILKTDEGNRRPNLWLPLDISLPI